MNSSSLAVAAGVSPLARGARRVGRVLRRERAGRRGGLPDGFIGGVVTSSRGPEAGVWVIAETDELKTPFIKIVVTDDAGRYVLPQLPTATYNVWVRGYGLADSDKVEGRPGDTALESHGEGRELAGRGREGLSRQLLVVVAAAAREERVPGHGRERQRHPARDGDAGALDLQHQERLQLLPPARQPASRARSATWITWDSRRPRKRGSIARSSACAAARWPARWRSGRRASRRARDGRLDDAHRERRAAAACRRGRGRAPSATSS